MVEAVGLRRGDAVCDDGWPRDISRVETSDEALCQRVAERDDRAFDLLVERYQQRAYRVAWSILRDAEEARDLSQEAFIRLYEAAGSFRGTARFSTWFYRILVNLCLDARRRRRWWHMAAAPVEREDGTVESVVEQQPGPSDDPVDGLAREQRSAQLWAAVEQLSPRQRAALVLRDVLGWSAKDTADLLGTSQTAVKSLLQRARPTLRRHLPSRRHEWQPRDDPGVDERVLLQRYMDAHEQDDVEALAALLREDVRVSYPPYPIWCDSRGDFIVGSRKFAPPGDIRFVPTRANMQPACAIYLRAPGDTAFRPVALEVLRIDGDRIAEIVDYGLPDLFPAFGLPATL
jgi:RNA polymerase sigma-70 factor (ECF subfamily)